MLFDTLEQFNVIPLVKCGYTNNFFIFSLLLVSFLFFLNSSFYNNMIKINVFDIIFNFFKTLFYEQKKYLSTNRLFPYFFSILLLILFSNIGGLLPFSITITSHILVTCGISVNYFSSITFLGLFKNGFLNFIILFKPLGVAKFIIPFIFIIEIISYFIRPLSLGIRLFANMLAGHILVFIVISFFLQSLQTEGFFSYTFFIGIFSLVILETAIAAIQTYVFTILILIYLADVYVIHSH